MIFLYSPNLLANSTFVYVISLLKYIFGNIQLSAFQYFKRELFSLSFLSQISSKQALFFTTVAKFWQFLMINPTCKHLENSISFVCTFFFFLSILFVFQPVSTLSTKDCGVNFFLGELLIFEPNQRVTFPGNCPQLNEDPHSFATTVNHCDHFFQNASHWLRRRLF